MLNKYKIKRADFMFNKPKKYKLQYLANENDTTLKKAAEIKGEYGK